MKVKHIMERAGMTQAGRALAYIREAMHEIELMYPNHISTFEVDLVAEQRQYDIPWDCMKIIDIQCKNHDNTSDQYRSIPRLLGEPVIKDKD